MLSSKSTDIKSSEPKIAGTYSNSNSEKSYLTLRGISKHFGATRAVDAVDVNIQQGEIFALLGSSGCGKSTLLRMLAGFEVPTHGKILLNGQDITGLAPYDRPINMMFQSYALFPHMTVADNVAYGLKRDGMSKADIVARVDEMLGLVQLRDYAARKPHQLSGGQQQRVALARSLAKRPQLLLLDEPLGALDKKLREETQIELVNIIRKVGVTCVLVTHDQEEAKTMADRIAVMSKGRLVQVDTPATVYETPNSRFVADFIGNVNLFHGTLVVDEPGHVEIKCPDCTHYVGHGITGTLGMEVYVAVRPEKMHVSLESSKEIEKKLEKNQLRGVISAKSYFGSSSLYHLKSATGNVFRVEVENAERHGEQLAVGQKVLVTWPDDAQIVLTQ